MLHIDLFSGIGGFALAVDTVWPNSEHIFVDNDPFCQKVLKKHWPNSPCFSDIRGFTSHTVLNQHRAKFDETREARGLSEVGREALDTRWVSGADILTGGFPCQPFSQAGRRQGTADDRYLWPEMFRVIREFSPRWVIAENVSGLVTWNEGMVLEQVCSDLESEGYEVQPFVIPAVAKNAPHRRDRVWIVGYAEHDGQYATENRKSSSERSDSNSKRENQDEQSSGPAMARDDAQNSLSERSGGRSESSGQVLASESTQVQNEISDWSRNWIEVATELCGVDDGLPAELDGLKLSKSKHRAERLKSLGNAIVPQVAIEIMKAIKDSIPHD